MEKYKKGENRLRTDYSLLFKDFVKGLKAVYNLCLFGTGK